MTWLFSLNLTKYIKKKNIRFFRLFQKILPCDLLSNSYTKNKSFFQIWKKKSDFIGLFKHFWTKKREYAEVRNMPKLGTFALYRLEAS